MNLNPPSKIVLSASRRTDIPAFYMPWFMKQIKRGVFEVVNPFNRQVRTVPATPADVHTIVFWSKDFGLFLKENQAKKLQQAGYHLFFNFTLNSSAPVLEPHVPPLDVRLKQLEQLCDRFGSSVINWRFDPICFFRDCNGELQDNLHDLSRIAEKAAECGIERCITSFLDFYPKIDKRIAALPGFSFSNPPPDIKKTTVLKIEQLLSAYKINLKLCCEKEVMDTLPDNSSVTESSCIPNDLFLELFGGNLSLKKDTGQRIRKGCGCKVSVDIGSYHHHPCFHNCLFCYANPIKK
jgi:DNA repair photolyase